MDLGSDASVLIFALFLLLHLNKQGNYLCKRNPFCILLMCVSRKFSQGGLASDKSGPTNCTIATTNILENRTGTGPPIPPLDPPMLLFRESYCSIPLWWK